MEKKQKEEGHLKDQGDAEKRHDVENSRDTGLERILTSEKCEWITPVENSKGREKQGQGGARAGKSKSREEQGTTPWRALKRRWPMRIRAGKERNNTNASYEKKREGREEGRVRAG